MHKTVPIAIKGVMDNNNSNNNGDDDPFAVFGTANDSSDDDDEDTGGDSCLREDETKPLSSSRILAQSLMARVNNQPSLCATTTTASRASQLPTNHDDDVVVVADPVENHNSKTMRTDYRGSDRVVRVDTTTTVSPKTTSTTGSSSSTSFPKSSWPKPHYINPMIQIMTTLPFGGNRGFVATQPLPPGTLILVESPALTWSSNEQQQDQYHHQPTLLVDLNIIHQLFQQDNAAVIIPCMEYLHPSKQNVDQYYYRRSNPTTSATTTTTTTIDTSSNDGDNESHHQQIHQMMDTLRAQYHDSVDNRLLLSATIELAHQRNIVNGDGSAMTDIDILRILLVLRYNALQSGIYFYAALLNHSDPPNCVKFLPAVDSSRTTTTRYSEVRTTRTVHPGEPLTISYIPKLLSHASRRKYLWEQHRFDIGDDISMESLRQMELVHDQLPVSTLHNNNALDEGNSTTTHRIEATIDELEAMYKEILVLSDSGGNSDERSEQAMVLEQTALELCRAAEQQLGNHFHILLLPIYRLHVDCCCDLVQHDAATTTLSVPHRLQLLGRLVVSAMRLRELQTMLLGPDHFDIARTNLDLVQTIEELLSRSPKHLVDLNVLEGLQSTSHWAALAYKVQQDHDRIRMLYPNDAGSYVH